MASQSSYLDNNSRNKEDIKSNSIPGNSPILSRASSNNLFNTKFNISTYTLPSLSDEPIYIF